MKLTYAQANRAVRRRPRGAASHECPRCGRRPSRVLDTRPLRRGVQRVRECQSCRHKFITRERTVDVR